MQFFQRSNLYIREHFHYKIDTYKRDVSNLVIHMSCTLIHLISTLSLRESSRLLYFIRSLFTCSSTEHISSLNDVSFYFCASYRVDNIMQIKYSVFLNHNMWHLFLFLTDSKVVLQSLESIVNLSLCHLKSIDFWEKNFTSKTKTVTHVIKHTHSHVHRDILLPAKHM